MTPNNVMLLLNQLRDSLARLAEAVDSARASLGSSSSLSTNIEQRFDSYNEILIKQETLASELEKSLKDTNTIEESTVNRTVTLINSLSQMIRDDTIDLAHELVFKEKLDKESLN